MSPALWVVMLYGGGQQSADLGDECPVAELWSPLFCDAFVVPRARQSVSAAATFICAGSCYIRDRQDAAASRFT